MWHAIDRMRRLPQPSYFWGLGYGSASVPTWGAQRGWQRPWMGSVRGPTPPSRPDPGWLAPAPWLQPTPWHSAGRQQQQQHGQQLWWQHLLLVWLYATPSKLHLTTSTCPDVNSSSCIIRTLVDKPDTPSGFGYVQRDDQMDVKPFGMGPAGPNGREMNVHESAHLPTGSCVPRVRRAALGRSCRRRGTGLTSTPPPTCAVHTAIQWGKN